jgi:hypothetical protein
MTQRAQFGKKRFFAILDQIRDEMALMNLLHERLLTRPLIVAENDRAVAQLSTALYRMEQQLKEIEAMAQREPDEEKQQ